MYLKIKGELSLDIASLLGLISGSRNTPKLVDFITENKGTYIGDNSITQIYANSSKYINAEVKYDSMDYEIDSKNNILFVNVKLKDGYYNENEEIIYKWAEQSSLITLITSYNCKSIVVLFEDELETYELEFTKEYLENKYDISIDKQFDTSNLQKILNNHIPKEILLDE